MNSRVLAASAAAVLLAVYAAASGPGFTPASAGVLSEHELDAIRAMSSQQQAERLLERAVSRYQGAVEEIQGRLPEWDGKLEHRDSLAGLIHLANNSADLRVRAAGVEIALLSNGVKKDQSVAREIAEAVRQEADGRPWRLWMLGLLANRGVAVDDTRRLLLDLAHDPAEETRKWAVNALAMLGTDDIIEPLLDVFAHDASAVVRERAGCGLAESGMLTREQRRKALPGLVRLADDPSIEAGTRKWVYQALREISGQGLADDPAAWRDWLAKQ